MAATAAAQKEPLLALSPTPVGEVRVPIDASTQQFPDWRKPSRCTKAASDLLDTWLPWLGYLGLGIGAKDFVLGSLAAGVSALLGLALQAYRFRVQRSLRIWPKANPLCLSLTWLANAAFVASVPHATAARYTLLVVITGVLLGNVASLLLRRPVLLEEALEHVESREEEQHPLFQAMHTRASYALLALSCVQWPSFFLAASFFPEDPVMAPILLVAVPVGSLVLAVAGIAIYLSCQRRRLRKELDRDAAAATAALLSPPVLAAQFTSL